MRLENLSPRELLAHAITKAEDDERAYAELAERLQATFPESAPAFDGTREPEAARHRRLVALYHERFGRPEPAAPSPPIRRAENDPESRRFLLEVVQPGLVGLMDGSVSTLAPVFAAAFATQKSHDAFLVGMAASLGAGISMGFAEALSDDGTLTGRGQPWIRGVVCGLMTTVGGVGHTLPFLVPDFRAATVAAILVVVVELAVITWIRHKYMRTPTWSAALQVGLGGALVFATGVLLGNS